MKSNRQNENGILLGIILILIAVGLLVSAFIFGIDPGPFEKGLGTILAGLYIQYLGLLFLLSYYFAHKSFLFRALIWVCEHFSMQPGKWNAFLYFGLGFFIGGVAILYGIGVLE